MNYLLTHSILNAALRRPEHTAFSCGSQSLTYAQLAKQMKQLARLLHELGAKKGERIGIYLNRSLETALAIYGVFEAGGVYVPLDPNAPIDRTRFLIEDCQIRFLISQSSRGRHLKKLLERKTGLQAIIGLDEDWPVQTIPWEVMRSMPSEKKVPERVMAQDLAYILYTSGSTGLPKGMMHTHYSGLSYAQLSADLFGLNENDRFGNHAPIHFDISTLAYFTAPLVGATTVIVPDAHTKLPASLSALMEKERLTIWYSVPLALIQLLQRGVLEERDLSSLRWIIFAGETFPSKYLKALMEILPKARFSNAYGPAEVNQCTYYHVDQIPDPEVPIPIGKVWGNTQMLILDEQDQEVPAGEIGELMIRSATMMQGYWNRPDLTKKGFYIREPIPGFKEVFYRTGDLVKEDETGELQFFGRKDYQVKVRGYRVELEAVENLLSAHEKIVEAVVFPYRKKNEEMIILGAVLPNTQNSALEEELILALKEHLPHYALPQKIFMLEEFPRTGTGKADRPGIKNSLLKKIEETYG